MGRQGLVKFSANHSHSLSFHSKIPINSLKIRKNSGKTAENQGALQTRLLKIIGEKNYSRLQTAGGKEYNALQTIPLIVHTIRGRKYSRLQTVGENKYNTLQTRLLQIIEGRKYSMLQTILEKEYSADNTTHCIYYRQYYQKLLKEGSIVNCKLLEKRSIMHCRQYYSLCVLQTTLLQSIGGKEYSILQYTYKTTCCYTNC